MHLDAALRAMWGAKNVKVQCGIQSKSKLSNFNLSVPMLIDVMSV